MSMFTSVWVKEDPDDGPLQFDPLSLVTIKHEVDEEDVKQEVDDEDVIHEVDDEDVKQEVDDEYDNECEPHIPDVENSRISKQAKKRYQPYQKKYYKKPTKILKCDGCEYTTVYKNLLIIHIRAIHENEYFKCPHCEYTTKYGFSLDRHILSYHQEDGKVPKLNGVDLPELKCEKCDYKTYKKWGYIGHLRKHTEEKKFQCSKCEYKTSYRNSFLKHSKTHEEKSSVVYKCDKCPFVTKYTGHIQRHLAKSHNVVSELHNFCDYCNFSTRLKWRLNIHVQKMKLDTKQECGLCDFKTLYKCQMKVHKNLHIKRIHNSKNINEDSASAAMNKNFEDCDTFNNMPETVTDTEMSENNSTKALTCTEQNLTDNSGAKSAVENKEGMQNFSEPTSSSFNDQFVEYSKCLPTCSEIPKNSDNSESFNDNNKEINASNFDPNKIATDNLPKSIHIISLDKTKRKINTDAMCNQYMFSPKSIEGISIQVLETNDKNKPFQCNKCEYGSKFKSAVIRHNQRQHTGSENRPYNCCNCDFSTKTKDQIGLHNKRSKSEIEITCTDCDFATYYKCQLAFHLKSHYKFRCTQCTYSSRKENELTRHYAVTHLGNGVQCRYCDYKAARKESVLLHETIHTGEKPHKCVHCDYSSVRKSLLNIHMKRFHNELQVVKIVNPNDLQSKIQSLQVKVPSVEINDSKISDNNDLRIENNVLISDERVSLSENHVLLGNKVVRIDNKYQINNHSLSSLMGLIGYNDMKELDSDE